MKNSLQKCNDSEKIRNTFEFPNEFKTCFHILILCFLVFLPQNSRVSFLQAEKTIR